MKFINLFLVFSTLLAIPLSALSVNGPDEFDLLGSGVVGRLKIGQSMSEVKARLHRQTPPDFLGDHRLGFSLAMKADFSALALDSIAGTPVSGVELLFTEVGGTYRLTMISLTVQCQAVSQIVKTKNGKLSPVELPMKDAQWTAHDVANKYVWGAQSKPSCNVWLRKA